MQFRKDMKQRADILMRSDKLSKHINSSMEITNKMLEKQKIETENLRENWKSIFEQIEEDVAELDEKT